MRLSPEGDRSQRRENVIVWRSGLEMYRRAFVLIAAASLFASTTGDVFAMDQVRQETRTDLAIAKYSVTGRGVAVAILDRGIDWRNPDFIKPDGTTRIKAMLDMSGQNWCSADNPPPVAYSEQQINAALTGGPPIAERDAVGHGTATAGVVAGSGRAAANGKYRGMAPEADLLIVKLTSEGAPAHDGQPAEAPFNGCIDQALDWLDGQINALGEPTVAIINSGTQWGPIDGTSAVSRKLDLIFGASRPGRVFVAPAGDEGAAANHAGASFDDTAMSQVRLNKATTDTVYMQLWYTGAAPAQVTVTFDDGTAVGPVGPGASASQAGITIFHYLPGQEFYPWQSTSGDRAIWFQITGHSGGGSVGLQAVPSCSGCSGLFDVYGDLYGPNLTSIVSFDSSSLASGRLTDYASTLSAISIANYVVRTSYVDVDGVPRDVSSEGNVGQLWTKSSGGPTRDGRLGIDIAAPGQNLFTSSARNSYWSTLRFNLVQDGGGNYVRFGGTSGSAPIVAGAVALLLQYRPGLTASDVRALLSSTAVADSFTGATPNPSWGYGKLDVLGAMDALAATPSPVRVPRLGAQAPHQPGTATRVVAPGVHVTAGKANPCPLNQCAPRAPFR